MPDVAVRVLRMSGNVHIHMPQFIPFLPRVLYVECERRRDGALLNFIAYGKTAKLMYGYLRAGDMFVIEYVAPSELLPDDDGDYDGELIGARDLHIQ